MSKEEKEVVEWLKQSINEYNDIFQGKIEDESGIKRMKTIKNLIEKQQKEINNLAKRQNDLIDEYENELLEKNNYIFQLENEREALHKLIDEEM